MAGPKLIDDPNPGLLKQPLEWFAAEHYRHRQFCALLRSLARSVIFEPEPIRTAADFLRDELARHLAEEEEELFPLLRARARPDDEADEVLRRLTAEHHGDDAHGGALRAHLERCLETRTAPGLDPAAAAALNAFAGLELRHLALENAVVLPLAKLRLPPKDLRALSRRLAARRGLRLRPEAA